MSKEEVPDFSNRTPRLVLAIVALVSTVLANVFIVLSVSGIVLVQLIASGYNRYVSLFVALLIAISTHMYILHGYKIRNFMNKELNK
jgi:hypothetical protein